MTLDEIRSQYPQYNGVSDVDLAAGLHAKYYSQVPMTDFVKAIGLDQSEAKANDPTQGTSGLQRGWEAFGSTLPRIVRGAKQLIGGSHDAEAEARRLEKPLMDTTAGKVGRVIGDAAVTAPAFMAGGGIPAAIVAGGALGFSQPVVDGESRAANTALGSAGGAGGVVAGRVLPAAFRVSKAAIAPFFESGQRGIAARAALNSADDPALLIQELRGAQQHVPGSQPTFAEATQQVGPARMEKSLRQRDAGFAEDLLGRQEANNAARMQSLQGIAGTDAEMAAAKAARESAAASLYSAAKGVPVKGDAALLDLMQRPGMKDAISEAETIMKNRGVKSPTAGDYLHTVKMALDGMIATAPQKGIAAESNRAVQETRQAFLNWFESKSPDYKLARETYAQMSQPINQMEAGQELLRRSTGNVQDRLGNQTLQENRFSSVLKNDPELLQPLSTAQRQTVENVQRDLSRAGGVGRRASAAGSDTSQNLIGQNLMSQSLGAVSPLLGRLSGTAPVRALGRLAQMPYQWAGTEKATQEQLARLLMMAPQEAAKVLESVTPSQRSQLMARLLNTFNAATGTSALVSP